MPAAIHNELRKHVDSLAKSAAEIEAILRAQSAEDIQAIRSSAAIAFSFLGYPQSENDLQPSNERDAQFMPPPPPRRTRLRKALDKQLLLPPQPQTQLQKKKTVPSSPEKSVKPSPKVRVTRSTRNNGEQVAKQVAGKISRRQRLAADQEAWNESSSAPVVTKKQKRSHSGEDGTKVTVRKISDKPVTPAKERTSTPSELFLTPQRRFSDGKRDDNNDESGVENVDTNMQGDEMSRQEGDVAGNQVKDGEKRAESDVRTEDDRNEKGVVQKRLSPESATGADLRPTKVARVEGRSSQTKDDALESPPASNPAINTTAEDVKATKEEESTPSTTDVREPSASGRESGSAKEISNDTPRKSDDDNQQRNSRGDPDDGNIGNSRKSGSSTEQSMVADTDDEDVKSTSEADAEPTSDEETPVIRRQRVKGRAAHKPHIQNSPKEYYQDTSSSDDSPVRSPSDLSRQLEDTPELSREASRSLVEEPGEEDSASLPDITPSSSRDPNMLLQENTTKTLTRLQQLRKAAEKKPALTTADANQEEHDKTEIGQSSRPCDETGRNAAEQERSQQEGGTKKDPGEEVFKVPGPIKRRKPPQPNSIVAQAGMDQSSQEQARNQFSASQLPETAAQRSRFVVDENGRVSKFGIGALSKIASTPAGEPKGHSITQIEPGSARGRFFKPTADIYSAKRGAAAGSSVQRSRLTRPTTILRTPGARTPLKAGTSKKSIVWQDLAENQVPPLLASFHAPDTSKQDTESEDHVKLSVLKSLETVVEPDSVISQESGGAASETAEDEKSSQPVKDTTRKLTFASATEEKPPGPSDDTAPSSIDEARNKIALLRETNRSQPELTQPETAPGRRPRPRIEGKQVKSALRCRIESLRAERSASRPLTADVGGPRSRLGSSFHSNGDNTVSDMDSLPSTQSSAEIIAALAASARKPSGIPTMQLGVSSDSLQASKDRSSIFSTMKSSDPDESEVNYDESDHSDEKTEAESEPTLSEVEVNRSEPSKTPSTGKREESEEIHQADPPSRADADRMVSTEGTASLEQIESDSDSENEETQLDVPVPSSFQESTQATAIEETEPAALTKDVEESCEAPEEEEKQPAGMLSNLVSSVTSFLPTSFAARPDEQSAETAAKAAAKKQRQDAERREAEVLARREAQRLAKQKEAEEKQRKAEQKRRMIEEAERHKAEEKRRKEELRMKKRQEEEMRQRREKQAEDRKREEHRQKVLEHKRQIERTRKEAEAEARRNLKEKAARSRPNMPNVDNNGSKLKTYKPGTASSRLPPSGTSKIPRAGVQERSVQGPKTPKTQKPYRPEEITSYQMTAEKPRGDSESSDETRARRKRKPIPSWAGKESVLGVLKDQNQDPDYVFSRVHTCNLDDVFKDHSRPYRPRGSSGNWTKDRLTAKEEVEFKRKQGYFENA